ncbi:MAG TPA: hypothetical protein ACHBY4_10050 [Arsenophonus apicola]
MRHLKKKKTLLAQQDQRQTSQGEKNQPSAHFSVSHRCLTTPHRSLDTRSIGLFLLLFSFYLRIRLR